MDFRPSTEQQMLRDSVRHYLTTEQSFEHRRRRLVDGQSDAWAQFAEFGWLAMAVPEDADGLGSELTDIAIVCEELGRALGVDPYVASGVLPARLLALAERTPAVAACLGALAAGAVRCAVALYERAHRYGVFSPALQARQQADGSFRLSGRKILVAGGGAASELIVVAQQVDAAGHRVSACDLFAVSAAAAGLTRRVYCTLDDVEVADFAFEDTAVPAAALLAFPGGASAALEQVQDEATVCLCADLLGGMDVAVQSTADYLRLRKQFGQPLAQFQALQHAVAEMFIDVSDARSMLYHALGAQSESATHRRKAVSACKIKVAAAAKSVTSMAVHLHGGIGVTSEYPVGHFLRRAMVAERSFGDEDFHLERYLDAGPAVTGVA